jgi:hypothetical protein
MSEAAVPLDDTALQAQAVVAASTRDCRAAPKRSAGRTDYSAISESAGSAYFLGYRSSGSSFGARQWGWLNGGWMETVHWSTADVDGDGTADHLAAWNNGGSATLTVRRRVGGQLVQEHWLANAMSWVSSTEWIPGDFDGDGRGDLMAIWQDGTLTSFTWFRSNGNSFDGPVTVATRDGGFSSTHKWTSGDFDGNGTDDLIGIWNDGGLNTLTVRRLNNNRLSHEHWAIRRTPWAASTRWLAGDFNADGRADIVSIWKDGTETSFTLFASNGTSFPNFEHWALRQGGWMDNVRWLPGDFDGDGRSDILAAWNDGGRRTMTVRRSTAAGLTHEHWAVRAEVWTENTRICSGNFIP